MTGDLIDASVMATRCPRCSAAPFRPCKSVKGRRRGKPKLWVHVARIRAAS